MQNSEVPGRNCPHLKPTEIDTGMSICYFTDVHFQGANMFAFAYRWSSTKKRSRTFTLVNTVAASFNGRIHWVTVF